jgi:glucosamine-6-phosphate deaminase
MNIFKLHIKDDYKAMSECAAEIFAREVAAAPTAAYGFATGGTPEGMYAQLLRMGTDLTGITAFNLDEYHPISPTSNQSYAYFMAEKLFDAAGVPAEKRNIPSGTAADPLHEAEAYDKRLAAAGGIQMQILGIGGNGHIAFNEPSDNFPAGTAYVELAKETIAANSRYFATAAEVPRHALTMGIGSIMQAKKILLLASGAGKAKILKEAFKGMVTPRVPASILQFHPDVTVVCDREAAAFLE